MQGIAPLCTSRHQVKKWEGSCQREQRWAGEGTGVPECPSMSLSLSFSLRPGGRKIGAGGSGLLDLPLGVKIPVQPGTKPVFCRTKLGEKVRRGGKGQEGLLFPGIAIVPRRPWGHLLCRGNCGPLLQLCGGMKGRSWLHSRETVQGLPTAVPGGQERF